MENVFIHDNIINSFTVDLDNEAIYFKTTTEDAQTITIAFHNVLAHKFDHVIKNNILLDIVEIPINHFINDYKENLNEWLRYCFPTTSSNCEDLESYLGDKKYKIFCIQASLGLNGFIIAKSMDFKSER